jgi:hypothetical protein
VRALRIDSELDARLRRAAEITDTSVSEFIRRAAADRADDVLGDRPSEVLSDVLGSIHGGGGRARRTGDAFRDVLAERRRRA